MKEANNNAFRDEQLRAVKILRKHMEYDVIAEHWVRDLSIDGKPYPSAKLDIAVPDIKWGIRLMGPPHKKKVQKRKDGFQRMALEALGWKIFDFWYDEMPNLWSDKRTSEIDELSIKEVLEKMQE